MGTVKTVASDIAKGNEMSEVQAMQLIIVMWAWGFLISPVISGALAEPIRQYPQWEWLQTNSLLTTVLNRYPFLLPNLCGAALCLVAMLTVWLFVPEPVLEAKRRSVKYILSDFLESCWICLPTECRACSEKWRLGLYKGIPLQDWHLDDDCGYGVDSATTKVTKPSPVVEADSSASIASMFARRRTRTALLVSWIANFVR
jgi:MFS family permease